MTLRHSMATMVPRPPPPAPNGTLVPQLLKATWARARRCRSGVEVGRRGARTRTRSTLRLQSSRARCSPEKGASKAHQYQNARPWVVE